MGFGVTELLILLAIVLLLFGGSKLKNLGGDLGSAIKGFRKAMSSEDAKTEAKSEARAKEELDDSSEMHSQKQPTDDKPAGS